MFILGEDDYTSRNCVIKVCLVFLISVSLPFKSLRDPILELVNLEVTKYKQGDFFFKVSLRNVKKSAVIIKYLTGLLGYFNY